VTEFDTRIGIKALDGSGVERLVAGLGQPRYRAEQLIRWLYQMGVRRFEEMTDLPTTLRQELSRDIALPVPDLVAQQVSQIDGTRKYLWRLADETEIESVGLPSGDRLTVCFSTQAGCAMGCTFCATGRSGFVRDLAPGEMVDQVRLVGEDFGRRVTNAVAMGQGEPFANYEATLGALKLMNSENGLGIGARHLTVSTCGLIGGIERFATEPEQFTLAVSLHSAVQETRDSLMPAMSGAPLSRLRTALADYEQRTGRRPTLEFALITGVNDTDAEREALVRFCRGLHCHVNLILVNPVSGNPMNRSSDSLARAFVVALGAAGTESSVRVERGTDIDAACGQLKQRISGGDA
jgi:23S rRNA (adenine2503-C2)-methyltransferase